MEDFNQLNHWNGSTWSAVTFNGSIFDNNGSNFIEVRLPKSDLDAPNCIYALGYFINEQGGNEWTYASWPDSSLVDGYYTNGYFNHWWGYNLTYGISPDAGSNYDQQLGPPNFNIFLPIVAKS